MQGKQKGDLREVESLTPIDHGALNVGMTHTVDYYS